MSLFVVHDLQRPAPLAIRGLYFAQTENVEDAPIPFVHTNSEVITRYAATKAARAALANLYQNSILGDLSAATVEYGDATSILVVPWSAGLRPLGIRPWSSPVDSGDAPPPPDVMGDATAINVIVYRPWQNLKRWRGLYENTAQDDDGPNFNYGTTSDYFVQYDPITYSPMSRLLYQTAPAHDESDVASEEAYVVNFVTRRAKPAPMRHNFSVHLSLPEDNSSEAPIGDAPPLVQMARWAFHRSFTP